MIHITFGSLDDGDHDLAYLFAAKIEKP